MNLAQGADRVFSVNPSNRIFHSHAYCLLINGIMNHRCQCYCGEASFIPDRFVSSSPFLYHCAPSSEPTQQCHERRKDLDISQEAVQNPRSRPRKMRGSSGGKHCAKVEADAQSTPVKEKEHGHRLTRDNAVLSQPEKPTFWYEKTKDRLTARVSLINLHIPPHIYQPPKNNATHSRAVSFQASQESCL